MLQLSTAFVSGEAAATPTVKALFASGEAVPIDAQVVATGGAESGGTASVLFYSTAMVGSGGAESAGTAPYVMGVEITATGGAESGGTALVAVPTHTEVLASGGAESGGSAIESHAIPEIAAGLTVVQAAMVGQFGGAISAILTPVSCAVSGYSPAIGVIGARMTVAQALMSGGVYSIVANLSAVQASLTGLSGTIATIASTLPVLGADITGAPGAAGTIAARLPLLAADLAGISGMAGQIDARMPVVSSEIVGLRGTVGTISASLTDVRAALLGAATVYGTIAAALPAVSANISAGMPLDGYVLSLVVNAETVALTQYDAYAYNSMMRFAGMTIAADASGLHQLDAAPAGVVGRFATGVLSFGSEQQKRAEALYMGLRSVDPVSVTVDADELPAVDYTLAGGQETIEQRRVKFGKGAKGKYWRITVEGQDFEADSMNIAVTPLSRRI